MLRVALAYSGHRLLLLVIAFLAINLNSNAKFSVGGSWARFTSRVSDQLEFDHAKAVMAVPATKVFSASPNPFFWLSRWVSGLTRLSTVNTLLILSNLFALLFMMELYAICSRMVTEEAAMAAVALAIVWPTSYEISVGGSFSFTCFLAMLAIRRALDNQWLITGIALGILALADPVSIGLAAILLFIFWFYQRQSPMDEKLKRAAMFLVPFAVAVFLRWGIYRYLGRAIQQSALLNVFSSVKSGGKSLAWTVSNSYVGQTLSIIFFGLGAGLTLFSSSTLIHRLLPLFLWILLLAFSPYPDVASHALIAAVCLEGISSSTSRPVLRTVQGLLACLGGYEVYLVFSFIGA